MLAAAAVGAAVGHGHGRGHRVGGHGWWPWWLSSCWWPW